MKKHLQKYLFEEKVCNLVTEISSKETGGIPEPNTNVILKRNTKNIFYKDDHLFFDKNTSKLVINNEETKLTPLEFKLLSGQILYIQESFVLFVTKDDSSR